MMISSKQRMILAFPYSGYDALICDGAIRSGKTSIMMWGFVDWAMRNFSGQRFGICGKTVDSAGKNIIVPFLSLQRANQLYRLRWRRTEKILEVQQGKRTNYFEVFGGKDESSFTLIQGRTLAGALLDEVALMPRSFVEQALARCSVAGSKLWFNCNPGPPTHWFYEEWIKKREEKNALYLHFALDDNPSLAPEIIQRYRAMYTGVFYERYILGRWVRAEGIIYDLFANEPKRYEARRDQLPELRMINVGVDFGGNKSAFAFVASGITENFDVIALRSKRVPAAGVSVEAMTTQFQAFCAGVEKDYGEIDRVYADLAEQAIINTLRQQTEYQIANSVKGQIIDRVRTLNMLLATDRFRYVEGECDSLKAAISDAVWDDKKWEDVRLDDGTSDIDTMDAFEYSWSAYIRQILRG